MARGNSRYRSATEQGPRRRGLLWLIRRSIIVAACAVALVVAWLFYFAFTPLIVPETARQLQVGPGSSYHTVARQLATNGVLHERFTFIALGRLQGKAGTVKAGIYELPAGISPLALIQKLARGDVLMAEVTFIEGWTFAQLRAALDASPSMRHDTAGLNDTEILQRLKAPETQAEGLFFPDTYRFNTGASDLQVLGRAYQKMHALLQAAWDARGTELPYATPYEALIMASIVEKETGRPEDRRLIAAVFVNRLKRGMRLQTDPSVIYGIGPTFDGNLRKQDLLRDGPYNTYTRAGLPPTPIALAGQASLDAALAPAASAALYFVSRGDGTSYFSETLEEHNRAVRKYQLKQ
jgi:peptidoglycan lytic transglycosylase G